MDVLLTIILIFFALSFLGRLFFRYVLPWWLSRFMKKQQQKFNQQYYSDGRVYEDKEVRINKESGKGAVNPDVGEYVDYEEIDDNNDNKTI